MGITVAVITALTFKEETKFIHTIKYLLFLQAIQMQISNFNAYQKGTNDNENDGFTNYQGLNMLSTVFSVMFTIFNTILMSFLFEDKKLRNVLISITYTAQTFILYFTNFIWDDVSYHTVTALTIAILFTIILIPSFGYLTDAIMQESINEQKINFQQKDNFRKMFDSL